MDLKKMQASTSAFLAGISLIIMTVLAFAIFSSLKPDPCSITGIAAIIILDIIVATSLYFLLKPSGSTLSLLMSGFRIMYALVFAAALYNISDLTVFYSIWDRGFLFFGAHLLLLGILVIKSRYIPSWLGFLIIMSSFGYIADSIIKFLGYSLEIGMFTFWGEVVFALWLVIQGRKISSSDNKDCR